MTDRLDPARPYGERRQFRRRDEDSPARRPPPAESPNLPVPAAAHHTHDHSSPPPLDGQAAFAAQLLGADEQRRGLRAGPVAIEAAQAAYLEAEYSGPADRRPGKGLLKKADI